MSNASRSEEPAVISAPLQLHFRSVNKIEVVAGDAGDDRYETTLAEMAEACRQKEDFRTWKMQFEEFLGKINDWCLSHKNQIRGSYLSPGEGGMKLFVTTQGERYRFDFDNEIVDLELELHRVYSMCPVEVLQMPDASPDALKSFFSPDNAFQIYG